EHPRQLAHRGLVVLDVLEHLVGVERTEAPRREGKRQHVGAHRRGARPAELYAGSPAEIDEHGGAQRETWPEATTEPRGDPGGPRANARQALHRSRPPAPFVEQTIVVPDGAADAHHRGSEPCRRAIGRTIPSRWSKPAPRPAGRAATWSARASGS